MPTNIESHTRKVPDERVRVDGRAQGQGWFLENETEAALLREGYRPHTRVRVWKREVDIVARREWLDRTHRGDGRIAPKRVVVSCVDWFSKNVTPSRLWRLITMGFTLRAEPVLVHNRRAELTKTAREIAEQWRVRDVTYQDIQNDIVLPEPEKPDMERNSWWPSPMYKDVNDDAQRGPDYYYDIGTPNLERGRIDQIYRGVDY